MEPRDFGVENPICGPKSYMCFWRWGKYFLFFYFSFQDVEPRDFGVENPICGPKSYMCNFFFDFFFDLFFDCSTNPTLSVWEKIHSTVKLSTVVHQENASVSTKQYISQSSKQSQYQFEHNKIS